MDAETLKERFWAFGETASVMGERRYSAVDELDYFATHRPDPDAIRQMLDHRPR